MSLHRTTQDGVARAAAAVLCLAVAWIHIQDQGGFPGDKKPHYVAIGYYLLEGAGALGAALLLAGWRTRLYPADWLLAAAVATGPLLGYVLSRGPGLPNYSDDKGNWTEPLGVASLGVEGALLLLAIVVLAMSRRAARAPGL
ncbi:hypothetical protein ACFXKR_41225 [Streptomyces violascens]|uniref:hypothetical protein n=1 Tax=Streptomyces violascens TaxID=67381 RepID=UPI00369A5DC5